MKELRPITRHYLLLFPVLGAFLILGIISSLSTVLISYFILGFLWPWVLETPELREKVLAPRYKFSFFRFMFWIEDLINDQIFFLPKKITHIISRALGPLAFSFLLAFSAGFKILGICFIGVILGELWLFINKRFYPKAYGYES